MQKGSYLLRPLAAARHRHGAGARWCGLLTTSSTTHLPLANFPPHLIPKPHPNPPTSLAPEVLYVTFGLKNYRDSREGSHAAWEIRVWNPTMDHDGGQESRMLMGDGTWWWYVSVNDGPHG
jgi:hypothetical protein